jgi:hypothetical protein
MGCASLQPSYGSINQIKKLSYETSWEDSNFILVQTASMDVAAALDSGFRHNDGLQVCTHPNLVDAAPNDFHSLQSPFPAELQGPAWSHSTQSHALLDAIPLKVMPCGFEPALEFLLEKLGTETAIHVAPNALWRLYGQKLVVYLKRWVRIEKFRAISSWSDVLDSLSIYLLSRL